MKRNYLSRSKAIISFFVLIIISHSPGQTAREVFDQFCKSCHTINGGQLIGPDLKDVTQRQSREWLVNWIMHPMDVLNAQDPYALKLQKEAKGVIMPPTPGMTPTLANALLDLIENESKSASQASVPEPIPEISQQNVDDGKLYFEGLLQLQNGGPACINCHTVNSTAGYFGGGRLGPNLNDVYKRFGEYRGLSAWLSAPASLTMNPIFKKHPLTEPEIHDLVAFLKDESSVKQTLGTMASGNFIVIGFMVTITIFWIFGLLWGFRFKNVRRSMVKYSYVKDLTN